MQPQDCRTWVKKRWLSLIHCWRLARSPERECAEYKLVKKRINTADERKAARVGRSGIGIIYDADLRAESRAPYARTMCNRVFRMITRL